MVICRNTSMRRGKSKQSYLFVRVVSVYFRLCQCNVQRKSCTIMMSFDESVRTDNDSAVEFHQCPALVYLRGQVIIFIPDYFVRNGGCCESGMQMFRLSSMLSTVRSCGHCYSKFCNYPALDRNLVRKQLLEFQCREISFYEISGRFFSVEADRRGRECGIPR